jgi:hypothetical protein
VCSGEAKKPDDENVNAEKEASDGAEGELRVDEVEGESNERLRLRTIVQTRNVVVIQLLNEKL